MLLLRSLLGMIFLAQGYGKVFTWGVSNLYVQGFQSYEALLPKAVVVFAAYYTSYVELVCGLLLIAGIFRTASYYLLGSVLLIVAFGHGLQDPIWDLHHVFVRAALLIPLLLLPAEWDRWHLDRLLVRSPQGG